MKDRSNDVDPDEAERLQYERTKQEFLQAFEENKTETLPAEASDTGLAKLIKAHNVGPQYLEAGTTAPSFADLLGFSTDGRVGSFQLLELLGRGGMGVVYRARHLSTGQEVAVKFLRPSLNDRRFREKFRQEVEILGRLDHPSIGRFVATGTVSSTLGEMPYLALEFIEGPNLSEYVAQEALDVRTRLALVVRLCEALEYAHGMGVVHCDLKPVNILIRPDGSPCILDFGVASLVLADGIESVDEGTMTLLGTMSFMSPEQLHKGFGQVDARSDVFSLGVILYQLLTGKLPFGERDDPPAYILGSVLLDMPAPVTDIASDLSPHLQRIVAGCLVKEPEKRYPTMAALGDDLQRYLAGKTPRGGIVAPRFTWWHKLGGRWLAVAVLVLMVGAGLRAEINYYGVKRGLGRLGGYLEAADQGIHLGPRSEESLQAAITSLMMAKGELPVLRGKTYEQAVERYIDWRLGEAHLFLGYMRESPADLRLAREDFSRAYGRESGDHSVEELPLPATLLARIAYLKPHHPIGGRALTQEALANYEWPRTHLERAVTLRQDELASWGQSVAPSQDIFTIEPPAAMLFHDCGQDLVKLGQLLEDPDLVAEGLKYLLHVDDDRFWPSADHLGQAAFLASIGRARWSEAEMSGDAAKFAAAESRMYRSMAMRGGDASLSQARTRLVLAAIALSWAGHDPAVRADQLGLARLQAAAALATYTEAGRHLGAAEARVLLARISLLAGDPDRARELIRDLGGTVARSRRPVLQAKIDLVGAGIAAQTCRGTEAALVTMQDLLAQDNPRQQRRARELQTRLLDCRDGH